MLQGFYMGVPRLLRRSIFSTPLCVIMYATRVLKGCFKAASESVQYTILTVLYGCYN
jgi:hypothetical protein